MLESVKSQMKLELRTKAESDAQIRELEARQAEAQLKSQQIITALKTQVGEQSQIRVSEEACWSCFLRVYLGLFLSPLFLLLNP